MFRHMKYTEAVQQLAGLARQKAVNQDVLYHGTRYGGLIMETGVLFCASVGQRGMFDALRRGCCILGIAGEG
jgi:hypothetical protein